VERRESSFDPSGEELEGLLAEAAGLARRIHEGESRDPVLPRVTGEESRRLVDAPLPRAGRPLGELLSTIEERLLPLCRKNGHPRFIGYVQGSADPLGAIADLLASLLNQNVTSWRSAPGFAELERLVLKWLDEMVGFDGEGAGILVSGGSAANLTAIGLALDVAARKAGSDKASLLPRLCGYVSEQGHLSLEKAFLFLGMGEERIRRVAIDEERRMIPAELEARIEEDRSQGFLPACVCASAGTTNTGAIDPLEEIAEICRRSGAWLHVDGAYGAPAALLPEMAELRRGLGRADSLTIDPHKWLFAPIDVGCLLVRDVEASERAFTYQQDYVAVTQKDPIGRHAFFDHGMELTRRARALKVWMILEGRGVEAIEAEIRRHIALRERLDARIVAEEELELLGSGLSISCFRYLPSGSPRDDVDLDALNRGILDGLLEGGSFFLSPTVLEGRYSLRVCIVNFRTREEDIDLLVEEVLRLGRDFGRAAPGE